jgi:hypothetical protein
MRHTFTSLFAWVGVIFLKIGVWMGLHERSTRILRRTFLTSIRPVMLTNCSHITQYGGNRYLSETR